MKLPISIRPSWPTLFRRFAFQGAVVALSCLSVNAAVVTWNGAAGDGSVSADGNWVGGAAAPSGSDLVFASDSGGGGGFVDFDAGLTYNVPTLTFASTAPAMGLTGASASDIVNVTGAGTAVSNQSNFRQTSTNLTIQVGVTGQTWDGGSKGLSISAIDLQNNRTLTLTGTGTTATTRNEITLGIDGTGSSGIVKAGAGTLLYSGNNTYTGLTSVTGGILQLGASNRIANTSNLLLSNGAILNLANFGETVGSLTIGAGGGFIDFGAGAGNNTLVLADSSGQSWTGALRILNFNTGDVIKFGTSATALDAGKLSNIIFQSGTAAGNGTQTAQINATGNLAPAPVPEPASLMLIGLGFITVVGRRRRSA